MGNDRDNMAETDQIVLGNLEISSQSYATQKK